jgi:hypothetical protein
VYKIAAAHHVLDQITGVQNITSYSRTPLKWGRWPGTWTHQRTYTILSRQQGTKYMATDKSAGSSQEDLVAHSCHAL